MQPLQRDNIRLAATSLLLRERNGQVQVFMVKRPGQGDFPDLHVFPGGKVDAGDDLDELCDHLDDAEASRLLGVEAGGIRYWVAATRECFEECGVLLARRNGTLVTLTDPAERQHFEHLRGEVNAGRLGFAEMCRQEGLTIASDQLMYFSHWLTPESAPRRFDTRFFATSMPQGQKTLADDFETADSDWINPTEALNKWDSGEWQMIHPTFMTLRSIAPFGSVAEALAAVRAERHLPELTPELNAQGMQSLR